MLTVHHLKSSRSQRILWLLEELGVPYELVVYDRDPKTDLAPAALEKIHPLGKSPVITDGDATVAESAAILEYIVEKYGGGKLVPPKDTPNYRRYRYFMHYAEGSLMPFLLLRLISSKMRKAPFLVRPIAGKIADKLEASYVAPNLNRHVAFLAKELEGRDFFAGGELSAADIQMSFAMEAIAARVRDAPAVIKAWVARMHERPAYKKALERGGPFEVMTS
jgi:glutathione S-transferase